MLQCLSARNQCMIKSLGCEDVFKLYHQFAATFNNLARKTTRSVCYFDEVIRHILTVKVHREYRQLTTECEQASLVVPSTIHYGS